MNLFKKYDVPVPRYTSYPTVPYWSDSPTSDQWLSSLKKAVGDGHTPWSMYLHIPFCETLCTFCGCNTVITKDHTREENYIKNLHAEWNAYLRRVPDLAKAPLHQLHLGGGTPTFFSPENLKQLLEPLLESVNGSSKEFEGSIEVDPRRSTREQLETLYPLGFRRVSMGVQDFNEEVQRLINRIQPMEQTKAITEAAREVGFTSVNFDLIYGLPKQTKALMEKTALLTAKLRPDRIALYSFALVPWIKPAQRLFKDEDLPAGEEKRQLYELSREILLNEGYAEIGMDHFALKTDSLYKATAEHRLHRNFMGYLETRTKILLGLGVSAISETPTCFHQNEKVLPVYERRADAGEIPTLRGHLLSSDDQRMREKILKFMTEFEVELESDRELSEAKEFLKEMVTDGVVAIQGRKLMLTELGRPFLRNACVFFDHRLRHHKPETRIFSQAL